MSLDQLPPFQGVGRESFTRHHESGPAFLDPKPKRLADGRTEFAAFATRTPAVNDLEHFRASLPGGIELREQPASGVVHPRMTGFKIHGAHRGCPLNSDSNLLSCACGVRTAVRSLRSRRPNLTDRARRLHALFGSAPRALNGPRKNLQRNFSAGSDHRRSAAHPHFCVEA